LGHFLCIPLPGVSQLIVSEMKRTEPSPRATFTPPVWRLVAEIGPGPLKLLSTVQLGEFGGRTVKKLL